MPPSKKKQQQAKRAAAAAAAAAVAATVAKGRGRPRGRKQSPSRSGSPHSRSQSPRSRSGSPRSRSQSPRSRSGSPRRRSQSPRSRSGSPRRRSQSPRSRSGSPDRSGRDYSPSSPRRSPMTQARVRSVATAGSAFDLKTKYGGDWGKFCQELFRPDASKTKETVYREAFSYLMQEMFNRDLNEPDTRALLTAALPFMEQDMEKGVAWPSILRHEARLLKTFVLPNLKNFNNRQTGSVMDYHSK